MFKHIIVNNAHTRFRITPELQQTYKSTHDDSIYRAIIASSGKNGSLKSRFEYC